MFSKQRRPKQDIEYTFLPQHISFFFLIHEIFIKITHLGKNINTIVYIITENCIPSYKKVFYIGKSIPNLWQVLLSEIKPQNNTI